MFRNESFNYYFFFLWMVVQYMYTARNQIIRTCVFCPAQYELFAERSDARYQSFFFLEKIDVFVSIGWRLMTIRWRLIESIVGPWIASPDHSHFGISPRIFLPTMTNNFQKKYKMNNFGKHSVFSIESRTICFIAGKIKCIHKLN